LELRPLLSFGQTWININSWQRYSALNHVLWYFTILMKLFHIFFF
jgi:hypothetical protein